MLNNIINNLRNLEGKEVGSGYFKHVYSNEVDVTTISILDILENLKPYEVEKFEIINYEEEEESILEVEFDEFINIEEYEEIRSDNSCNWNAPISNDFDFRIYKSLNYNDIIVEFSVHRFGDVRYNYTEEVYLKFEDEYDFYEILEDSAKHFTIIDNDNEIKYYITIDVFNECPSITVENNDEYEDIYEYEALNLLEELMNNDNLIVRE